MTLPQTVESFVKRYERSATLRALVQLIPLSIGSALDTAVITRMQSIRVDRAREFFDELGKGEVELRPELLENNDFLHCFSVTADAALRTHRAEKVRVFARLLLASATQRKISGVAEYEELLNILEELSDRELAILSLLDAYETKYPKVEKENDLERVERYWGMFTNQIMVELNVFHDEIDAIMTRLTRSGCYETFMGNYPFSEPGGKGRTTPTFLRLKNLALKNYTYEQDAA